MNFKFEIDIDTDDVLNQMSVLDEKKFMEQIISEASDDDLVEEISNRNNEDFYHKVLEYIPQNLINEYADTEY